MAKLHRIRSDYEAVHHGGQRGLGGIIWIVLHDMESTNYDRAAENTGAWFEMQASGGSTHYGCDNDSIQRYLAITTIAYGAPWANEEGVHIEQMGVARWTRAQWMSKAAGTLDNCAWLIARIHNRLDMVHNTVPIRRLTDEQVRHHAKGVVTHRQLTRALGVGTHTDPGSGYPIAYVIDLAKKYHAEGAK